MGSGCEGKEKIMLEKSAATPAGFYKEMVLVEGLSHEDAKR